MGNRIARESLALFAEMPIEEVRRDDRFAGVLATVGADPDEFEWAVAFYNGHLSAADPAFLRRDVLAFAMAR